MLVTNKCALPGQVRPVRRVLFILAPCGALTALLSAALFSYARGFAEEQDSISTIVKCGGGIGKKCILPSVLGKFACFRNCRCLYRVQYVRVPDHFRISRQDRTEELIVALKKLRYLEMVTLEGHALAMPGRSPSLEASTVEAALPGVTVTHEFQ